MSNPWNPLGKKSTPKKPSEREIMAEEIEALDRANDAVLEYVQQHTRTFARLVKELEELQGRRSK